MLPLLRSLFEHQAWADSAIFNAVRAGAPGDDELRRTLFHIAGVQRFFLSLFLDRPFDLDMKSPGTLDEIGVLFRTTQAEALAFAGGIAESNLSRTLEIRALPGARPTLAEVMTQVVMHSQHHRGQCASRLRALGATPPTVDYILWIKDRPGPSWA